MNIYDLIDAIHKANKIMGDRPTLLIMSEGTMQDLADTVPHSAQSPSSLVTGPEIAGIPVRFDPNIPRGSIIKIYPAQGIMPGAAEYSVYNFDKEDEDGKPV